MQLQTIFQKCYENGNKSFNLYAYQKWVKKHKFLSRVLEFKR